jgi:hypothetical protein
VTASEQPGDAQALREEIERTRERLGATVEQLAAKADVKGRARARARARAAELAGQVTRRARSTAAQAREQAADGAGAARTHRGPLAVAAAALLAAIAFIIWQRSKR